MDHLINLLIMKKGTATMLQDLNLVKLSKNCHTSISIIRKQHHPILKMMLSLRLFPSMELI